MHDATKCCVTYRMLQMNDFFFFLIIEVNFKNDFKRFPICWGFFFSFHSRHTVLHGRKQIQNLKYLLLTNHPAPEGVSAHGRGLG